MNIYCQNFLQEDIFGNGVNFVATFLDKKFADKLLINRKERRKGIILFVNKLFDQFILPVT